MNAKKILALASAALTLGGYPTFGGEMSLGSIDDIIHRPMIHITPGGEGFSFDLVPNTVVKYTHPSGLRFLRYLASKDLMLGITRDGRALLWKARTGERVALFQDDTPIGAADLTPDGGHLRTASLPDRHGVSTIVDWDLSGRPLVKRLHEPTGNLVLAKPLVQQLRFAFDQLEAQQLRLPFP